MDTVCYWGLFHSVCLSHIYYITPPLTLIWYNTAMSKKVVIFIIILMIVVGTLGFFLVKRSKTKKVVTPVVTKEVPPTATPTPKPFDRSKLSIQVLNGSGEPGASKKGSDFLEPLGYNVVEVSNADNFKYEKVTIKIKQSKSEYLGQLKKDLAGKYEVGSISASLVETAREDAVVIIGK